MWLAKADLTGIAALVAAGATMLTVGLKWWSDHRSGRDVAIHQVQQENSRLWQEIRALREENSRLWAEIEALKRGGRRGRGSTGR